jgi:hypothetical protein
MDPKVWGPAAWRFLHLLAASSNTPEAREAFVSYIEVFAIVIPCKVCKQHFAENRRKFDIKHYLRNEEALLMWTYLMHDAVNYAQGKKGDERPNWLDIRSRYFRVKEDSDAKATPGSKEDYDPGICAEVCQETLATLREQRSGQKETLKNSLQIKPVKRK